MKPILNAAIIVFVSLAALPASAVPITYTLGTSGASGTLGGSAFNTPGVIFSLNADTDDIALTGFGDRAVVASSATVTFNGNTLDILSPIGLYAGSGGFGMWRPDDINLLDYRGGIGVDLSMVIATTTLTYEYKQWSGSFVDDVNTSAGVLVFDDQSGVSGTFGSVFTSTAPVPLPAGGWMLLAALAALAGRSKLARRRSSPA